MLSIESKLFRRKNIKIHFIVNDVVDSLYNNPKKYQIGEKLKNNIDPIFKLFILPKE